MEYLFKSENYNLNGLGMKVYNTLGPGFLEAVYQEAFEIELKKNNIPYQREAELSIEYEGVTLTKKYIADFVCYGKIIVEMKAVDELTQVHYAQLLNYLRATKNPLGILMNFGNKSFFQSHRVLNSNR